MKLNPVFKTRQGWRTINGQRYYFRSSWEVNYARYLEWLKENGVIAKWEYEPREFWFEGIRRGVVSYKPDFCVYRVNGTKYWIEVKGYMDAKSKTKIKRFAKYYPNEELHVVNKSWFKQQSRTMPFLSERWENDYTSVEKS